MLTKVSLTLAGLGLTACASTPPQEPESNEPLAGCTVTDCFNPQLIRDFEIITDDTLLVYVGGSRCPFEVEFTGTFCDVTFMGASPLIFRTAGPRPIDRNRVCSSDSNIGIDEGPFSTSSGGDTATPANRLPCMIQRITSLTDDQVLELYVEHEVAAPPPPLGGGEITVIGDGESEDGGTEEAASDAQPTASTAR